MDADQCPRPIEAGEGPNHPSLSTARGIELEFRGLKQTLNRAKLRCRNDRRLLAELHWSLMAMAVAELFALKEQLATARGRQGSTAEPTKRSLANTMRALAIVFIISGTFPKPATIS